MSDTSDKNVSAPQGEASSADENGTPPAQTAPDEVLSPEQLKQRDRRELFHAFGLLSQVGVTMLVCVVIGLFLGRMMDRLLGSSPWLLIFGALLGGASAIKVMYDIGSKK